MSDVFYPMGLIADLEVDYLDRTIKDEFEDGSTSARSLWGERKFKRKFTVRHAPLSSDEFRYLRSFFGARSGQYDSFWFRDNVHRGGNAKVRLAQPFPLRKNGTTVYDLELVFEEVAPIYLLPYRDDVLVAAPVSSSLLYGYFDPNREIYYKSSDATYGESTIKDDSLNSNDMTWQSAVRPIANTLGQYQYWGPNASASAAWGKTSSTFALGSGNQSFTIFCMVRINNSPGNHRIIASIGAMGTTGAIGLSAYGATIRPWIGSTSAGTGYTVSTGAWHSAAIVFNAGDDDMYIYVDGAFVQTNTQARSYSTGPISVLGAPDGTLLLTNGSIGDTVGVCAGQVLLFKSELDPSYIAALHNLFAYQYGLAEV